MIASILCVEFWLSLLSPTGDMPSGENMRVLYLTHAPILARRAADDLCDQVKLKVMP